MTRTLAIRARITPRPEAPFERIYDPLADDLVRGGPLSRQRFATRWNDAAALSRLAESKRAPLPSALCDELREYHRRLGAPPESLAAIEELRRGAAVCAVTGQQPSPLGGPLYSLHKTASSVGLAAVVAARTGVPCVPLFWMHGEDSDFAEIRSVTIADPALALHDLSLPKTAHRDGELIGSIPNGPLKQLCDEALARWAGLPAHDDVADLIRRSLSSAVDLGEAYSALVLALFGERGLVVIDPRLPSFRAAARPLIDRYLDRAEALSQAARRAGEELERAIGRRPLADASLDSFVFAIEDGVRRKISPDEARRAGPGVVLSPSVALRAAIQDGVFPTVAMACGAAEISYLAQLREVFEGLGVQPAAPVPRLGATWLPPAAQSLLDASHAEAWELVTGADQVLKQLAEREVPADVREEIERARAAALSGFERLGATVQRVDSSLPQMVESARSKVDYQYARLLEGLVGKVRHRIERQHTEWARLRYYLMPGDRLQERRLASLEPIAYRGRTLAAELADLAEAQARDLERGEHTHLVLDL